VPGRARPGPQEFKKIAPLLKEAYELSIQRGKQR
jgi:hypothetical protein